MGDARPAPPTQAEVEDVLRTVIDPELGADIVSLGMVPGVDVADDGVVTIGIKLTIGGTTVLEIEGFLDGETFSGSFLAFLTQDFFVVGDWQAMKQTAAPAPGFRPT